jgi:hypothetical protein
LAFLASAYYTHFVLKDRDKLLFDTARRTLHGTELAMKALERASESSLTSEQTALELLKDKLERVEDETSALEESDEPTTHDA